MCGRWNSAIIGDLQSDPKFLPIAEKLHDDVVRQSLCGRCVASDGLSIVGVSIDIGISIVVDFRLHYLDGPGGFSFAPSRFAVELTERNYNLALASFGCGLSEPDGDFWYTASRKDCDYMIPTSDYDRWAFYRSKPFGDSSLSSWVVTRSN